jgi:superoxide dismutase
MLIHMFCLSTSYSTDAYDALEPFIDESTMRVHHLGHHAAYTHQVNAALEKMRWDSSLKHLAKMGLDELLHHLDEVPEDLVGVIRNAGGEHALTHPHCFAASSAPRHYYYSHCCIVLIMCCRRLCES